MVDLVHFSSSSTEISHRFKAPVSVEVGYFGSRLGQLFPGAESTGRAGGERCLRQCLRWILHTTGLRQQYRFTPLVRQR